MQLQVLIKMIANLRSGRTVNNIGWHLLTLMEGSIRFFQSTVFIVGV